MADTPSPLETASTRALLARLLDEAAPVRRLRTPVARLGLWLIVVATIAGAVIGLGLMGVRSDLRVKLRDPVYLLEITALTVAGMLMAAGAFQEAVPGYQARWPIRRVALGFGLLAALLWFLQPRHGELAVTQFIGTGIGCASRTVVLAALDLPEERRVAPPASAVVMAEEPDAVAGRGDEPGRLRRGELENHVASAHLDGPSRRTARTREGGRARGRGCVPHRRTADADRLPVG